MSLSEQIFKLAKTPLGDLIVGVAFGTPLVNLLPVKKIKISDKVIAFWHPKPFWQKHIVLVPRKPIKSLTSISEDDLQYIAEIYKVIQEIIIELKWDKSEYSVLINGGNRQEINQIHFHLFSGDEI